MSFATQKKTSNLHCFFLYVSLSPLHIASRFGYDEIVSFLVAQPSTDRGIRNRDGDTAMDVVCRRAKERTSGLAQRIKQLLTGALSSSSRDQISSSLSQILTCIMYL